MSIRKTPVPDWRSVTATLLAPLVRAGRLGLVTDVDGTISPIVNDPDAARVSPANRQHLAALQARLALVAVISGRAAADVQARVGLPGVVYVGNHGLERWHAGQVSLAPEVAAHRPALAAAAQAAARLAVPGVQVEDKGATVSVHYRRTPDPASAAATLRPALEAITTRHGLALFQGRMVFELRPPLDINKGTALRQLVNEHRLDAALYLGDDTTDIDALVMARHLREAATCYGVGLAVESAGTPGAVLAAADAGVSGVESFLSWLLSACSASST
jgi:trehalose 6-phosphate phosphatase